MNLADIDLGSLTIPAFVAIFTAGWSCCRLYLVKPLEARVKALEARDADYRQGIDEELRGYRQQLLNQRVSG